MVYAAEQPALRRRVAPGAALDAEGAAGGEWRLVGGAR
jgi:hypothetical protein